MISSNIALYPLSIGNLAIVAALTAGTTWVLLLLLGRRNEAKITIPHRAASGSTWKASLPEPISLFVHEEVSSLKHAL